MNGTTVFVKGYGACVRLHVETPNVPAPNRTTSESLRTAVPWVVCYEFLQGETIIPLVASSRNRQRDDSQQPIPGIRVYNITSRSNLHKRDV